MIHPHLICVNNFLTINIKLFAKSINQTTRDPPCAIIEKDSLIKERYYMEEFYIDCDGVKLHAKLERPEGSDKSPLCILVHGLSGNMEEDHIIKAKDAMIDSGVAVLRVEMYGHGMSSGEYCDHTIYKWVINALAVVKYAKQLDFVTDLYMSGHSQGGFLTVLIAGMCPDDFKAIIPLSPALCIPDDARSGKMLSYVFDPLHIPEVLIKDQWVLGGDYVRVAQTIHIEDEIRRYNGPVYIVHGDADETVPYSYAEWAADLYENATLATINGADHCFTEHLDELYDAVKNFFGQ